MDAIFCMYWFLGATSVFIVATLVTGWKGRRRLHLTCVVLMVLLLLVTLHFAKETAKVLDFPDDRHRVHMPLARAAFYSLLAPLTTGIAHWYGKVGRRVHSVAVYLFLVVLVAALGTGAWMMMGATPKPL